MMRIYITLYIVFIALVTGCSIKNDASNELTAWDDRATANRETKQDELIRKQDEVLKRQQKEFQDLHRQENIQDEYRHHNLRQKVDDGDDSYS